MSTGVDLREAKEEIAQVQENLLKSVKGSKLLEISWCRILADMSFLQSYEAECDEFELVVERRFSLYSEVPTVWLSPLGKCCETQTLLK